MPNQQQRKQATAKAKAARKAAPVTSASDWKKDAQQGKPVPLTVPSGKTCLVQRPQGIRAFLAKGLVPNSLLPIVMEALDAADGKEAEEKSKADIAREVIKDPAMMSQVFNMADTVCIETVVEPKVWPIPVDDDGEEIPPYMREDDDKLYVDYIDDNDKMFIMNFAMEGQSEVEPFREEVASTVEALSAE